MSLSKETERGEIVISDKLIAAIIRDCMQSGLCKGKVRPSNAKGKKSESFFVLDDFPAEIVIERNAEGGIFLSFPVIIRSEVEIAPVSDDLAEYIREKLEFMLESPVDRIVIEVKGVFDRDLVKSGEEVIREYEFRG